MNGKAIAIILAGLLAAGANVALACEYKKGETKFVDYAKCRYGEDAIVVIELKDNPAWDQCVYQSEAFRPEKLLAVTKDENGKEILSINDRSQIGNPCYMTKATCDKALRAWKAANR